MFKSTKSAPMIRRIEALKGRGTDGVVVSSRVYVQFDAFLFLAVKKPRSFSSSCILFLSTHFRAIRENAMINWTYRVRYTSLIDVCKKPTY